MYIKRLVLSAVPLLVLGLTQALFIRQAQALLFLQRSIEINTAQSSATAVHTFRFTYQSISDVGSLAFQYCDNSPLFDQPCNAPPGLNVLSATLNSQLGNVGFSVDVSNSTANRLVLTRTPAAGLAVPSTYVIGSIINPSTPSSSQYVRLASFASTDATGPMTDSGGVAYAIQGSFGIGAEVAPFLNFCVGLTVAIDCSSGTGDSIDLGLLTPDQTRTATSQFAAGTNDYPGISIYALGTTMTSGNNTILALSTASPSFTGFSQFGINLRDNSVPNVGAEPDGPGTILPASGYGNANFYRFVPGGLIAESAQTTDQTRMTVSYIVNINGSQKPGVYAATITYLALGKF